MAFILGEHFINSLKIKHIVRNNFDFFLLFSLFISLVVSFSFAAGCALAVVLLKHKDSLATLFNKARDYFGVKNDIKVEKEDCDVCGVVRCNRHLTAPNREPWRGLFISQELDEAVDSVNYFFFLLFHFFFLTLYKN